MNRIVLFFLAFFSLTTFFKSCITAQSNKISIKFQKAIKKNSKPTKNQRYNWQHLDFEKDTILGASIDKAYLLTKNIKVKDTSVVVAIIDSDPDINHNDLKKQIWINKKEIPFNNTDDDRNGYIDDINGWNFVSSKDGISMIYSLMESTRILQKYEDIYRGKVIDSSNYNLYLTAKAAYRETVDELNDEITKLRQLKKDKKKYEKLIKIELSDTLLTPKKIKDYKTEDSTIIAAIKFMQKWFKKYNSDESVDIKIKRLENSLSICMNLDKDNRSSIVKDDQENINDLQYGSPIFSSAIDQLVHSTSVSGVIAANRTNNIGIKGIAENVSIMFLNIGTIGDYTDKDLALAIRYAVDNGARIINISQSKKFSIHEDWVDQSLKYAQDNNVLVVTSAGNSNLNLDIDKSSRYPNDTNEKGNEFLNNYITVGASSYFADKNIKQSTSNYGKSTVDIFAPGRAIRVLRPNNKYEIKSGTSYAAPIVSGIAAMLLSYYPQLTAKQLKAILLESVISFDIKAEIKGSEEKTPFSELSKSGGVVNAYNALLLAKKITHNNDVNN